MSKNNKNKEKDSKDVDKNPTEEKDSKDVDKNPTEEKDSKDGDKKSAAMKESNRKEVDKPFLQRHGMWILVAVLVAVIAVLLSYPPASTDCSALKDEIAIIKRKLNIVSKQIANHTLVMGKFEDFMNKSKDLRDDLEKVDIATEEIKTLLNDTVDVTSLLRSHALDKTNVLAVVALFFFMLIVLAFWLYHLHNKINNIVGTTKMTRNETVHKLSRSSRPENAICLISFNKSQATFQENLINVGLQGLDVPVMYNVISRHSQLTELPHCKLYVVCTEFNERHVIIEQEGVGLGDLKRTTHDAVQKLSGNMIIIYTHDPGSRSLPQGHLYNHNIYCVKSQPELVELRDANRFYSIYNKFTGYQIIQFSNTVRDSLNLR